MILIMIPEYIFSEYHSLGFFEYNSDHNLLL